MIFQLEVFARVEASKRQTKSIHISDAGLRTFPRRSGPRTAAASLGVPQADVEQSEVLGAKRLFELEANAEQAPGLVVRQARRQDVVRGLGVEAEQRKGLGIQGDDVLPSQAVDDGLA